MKQKTKNIILLSTIVCGLVSLAHAAYPTSYWQIGQANDVLEFNYGDENIASNVMAVYPPGPDSPEGAVVVNTFAPSDGRAQGGQALELDIGGDLGAAFFCDEDGNNCFTSADVGIGGLYSISSNRDFNEDLPATPIDGQRVYSSDGSVVSTYSLLNQSWSARDVLDGERVFNLAGGVVQVYDSVAESWEPTYTENMSFYDYEFPLPNAEKGDIVWNLDGEAHCCYNGNDWRLCNGGGRCAGSGGSEGAFTFNCAGNAMVDSDTPFKVGSSGEGYMEIPITAATAGIVTLIIEENGFYAERKVILKDGETGIRVYPIFFDGSGGEGTRTFSITSQQATGSCDGEATVQASKSSFDFYCPTNVVSPVDYVVGNASSGFINIQVLNATAGTATILVEGPEFTAQEEVVFTGGESGVFIDIDYNGTGTAGVKEFSISSAEGNGSCVGEATVLDTGIGSFTCTQPGTTFDTFIEGVPGTGGINMRVSSVTAGVVTLNINQDGFTKTHTVRLSAGQSGIFIPDVAYDGSGTAGTKNLTVTSSEANNACTAQVELISDPGVDLFTCTPGGEGSEDFILGTPSSGGVNLRVANTVPGGTALLEINQDGFTATHIVTFTGGESGIFIPTVNYDGSGTAGTKTLTITSAQATNTCTADVVVTDGTGEFDFVCTENAVATGDFQFGNPGLGTISVPIVANQAGAVTLSVSHNGFQATQNFAVVEGPQTLTLNRLNYNGTSGPGTVQFGIVSEHADSGCVGEAYVAPPGECPAGARVFSGIRPAAELYELPTTLEDDQTSADVDSKNYSRSRGPVVLTGITGNCTADLTCQEGTTEIVEGSETCKDCEGGTITGTAGAGLVGVNVTYEYDAFQIGQTQNVTGTVTQAQHGLPQYGDMTCDATPRCDGVGAVSLLNEYCDVECANGYSKTDEGTCVPSNCRINTTFTGANSGYVYTVNTIIPVGGSRTFPGPRIRTPQCLLEYDLTVLCTGPDTWAVSENNPLLLCVPPTGTGGTGTWGPMGPGPGAGGLRFCEAAQKDGSCVQGWSLKKTPFGGSDTPFGRKRNTQACDQSACDAPGDCNCTAPSWDCPGTHDPDGRPRGIWNRQGDDRCEPCAKAGKTVNANKYQLTWTLDKDIGFVTPRTLQPEKSHDQKVECNGEAICNNGSVTSKASAEECRCIEEVDKTGELTFTTPAPLGFTDRSGPVTSNDKKDIPNGQANNKAEFVCFSDGTWSDPQNEDCDISTVTCDEGFTAKPGECECMSSATAFFDGPRIKSITDFLVELFKK